MKNRDLRDREDEKSDAKPGEMQKRFLNICKVHELIWTNVCEYSLPDVLNICGFHSRFSNLYDYICNRVM